MANYITKAESTDTSGSDPILMAQLRVAAGLAQLEAKKYKLAARKFLETNPELGASFNDIVSPQDVAIYGAPGGRSTPTGRSLRRRPVSPPEGAEGSGRSRAAPGAASAASKRAERPQEVSSRPVRPTSGTLCALASFDRAELKAKVLDNANFRTFLELVPEVRELIHDFYHSRYASCLKVRQLVETGPLDPVLRKAPHLPAWCLLGLGPLLRTPERRPEQLGALPWP